MAKTTAEPRQVRRDFMIGVDPLAASRQWRKIVNAEVLALTLATRELPRYEHAD
jgi:hypothetical protein